MTYDYLVVGAGIKMNYEGIEGAKEALDDPDCPVGSMYNLDYAYKMATLRENFKGGRAIFTLPKMPVKCGGAPVKMVFLSECDWSDKGIRKDCSVEFWPVWGNMFPPSAKYAASVKKYADDRGIK